LPPQANNPSTPTVVPPLQNAPNNYIPPTIIVPSENPAEFPRYQNIQPIRVAVNNPPPNTGNSSLNKAGIFIAVFLLCAVGLVFAGRTVMKNMQPPEISSTTESAKTKKIEQPNRETFAKVSDGSAMLFEEATNQAEEALKKESTATTKFEWEEISNKYKRAYGLLTTIKESDTYYWRAQEKISYYQQRGDIAYQKSLGAKITPTLNESNRSNVSINVVPDSSPYPSTTTTKTTQPKLNLTMPGKQSAQNYIAYNYFDGYQVTQKVITSNEALFTSKVEQYTRDKNDSKTISIRIDGGGELKLKPPAYTPKLTAGNYPSAREISYEVTMNYAISYSQISCYKDASHSFTVNRIVYNDLYSSISFLDATFVLSCGNRKLMGRVHYDAS
jgi:hypothetical protein